MQHMVQEQWLSDQIYCLNETWTQWCLSGGAYSTHFYAFSRYLTGIKYGVQHASQLSVHASHMSGCMLNSIACRLSVLVATL